jgi:hypothetical protein
LAVVPVVTRQRKFRFDAPSVNSLSVTSSPFAVTVNAEATSAKFARKRQFRHEIFAAVT